MKIIFTQPFDVAKIIPQVTGRCVVLDIAFNAGMPSKKPGITTKEEIEADLRKQFEETTVAFISAVDLVAWVDHHPHKAWGDFKLDPRFILVPRDIAPACPPLITPELVASFGVIETYVSHGDFDGVISLIKALLGGEEPYPGADADSIVADSRIGTLSLTGQRYENAMKANIRDDSVRHAIVTELTWKPGDPEEARLEATAKIDTAAQNYSIIQAETQRLAALFSVHGKVAYVDATHTAVPFDLTALLLAGQKVASVAVVRGVQGSKTLLTVAGAPTWNFVKMFDLAGGMPNRVNLADQDVQTILETINNA